MTLSQLNALLNVSAGTSWELAGTLEDISLIASLPELVQRINQSNPELQRLGQERKIEESRRALLKAERIPNLGLQVGSDFNAPGDFRAGPRSVRENRSGRASGGASVVAGGVSSRRLFRPAPRAGN